MGQISDIKDEGREEIQARISVIIRNVGIIQERLNNSQSISDLTRVNKELKKASKITGDATFILA